MQVHRASLVKVERFAIESKLDRGTVINILYLSQINNLHIWRISHAVIVLVCWSLTGTSSAAVDQSAAEAPDSKEALKTEADASAAEPMDVTDCKPTDAAAVTAEAPVAVKAEAAPAGSDDKPSGAAAKTSAIKQQMPPKPQGPPTDALSAALVRFH